MGIFSRRRDRAPTASVGAPADPGVDMTVQRAVLAPVVSAMIGDGDVNDAETIQLSTMCTLAPVFNRCSAEDVMGLIRSLIDEIREKGHEPVVTAAAAQLSPALKETSFAYVARMVVADGVVNDHEVAAVNAIGAWLDVDEETGKKILDVVMIMQRPASA